MNYNLIIFDIDGVIADTVDDFRWIDEVYKREFPPPEKSGFDSWSDYLNTFGDAFRKLSAENGEEVFEGLNVTGQDVVKAYRDVQDKKERINGQFKPFDDARPVLQMLNKTDILVAGISNSADSNTRKFLRSNDLIEYFNYVRGLELKSFEQFKNTKKPNPVMLEEAIEILNVKKENTLMIGDSSTDQYASKNAGIDFIRLKRGENSADHSYEPSIDSLKDLDQFLN